MSSGDCIVGHCQEYNHEAIKQVEIQVGDGTGTDDDVYVEICSDVDNHCCETLFNSWMDDFKSIQVTQLIFYVSICVILIKYSKPGKNIETWTANDIGKCAEGLLYKIHK